VSPAAITVIELWPFYSLCYKCGCDTRAKLGWPYYEDFIIGDGEPWQEHGCYAPVCEWCYRELDERESAALAPKEPTHD
jgi:hypothetical protein